MNGMTIAAIALMGTTILAFGLVQFVPMSSESSEGFDFGDFGSTGSFEYGTTLWGAYAKAGGNSDTTSWFDSDADDQDGVGLIRVAIPIILAGMVATLIALILGAVGSRMGSGVTAAVGATLLLVGFILWVVGHGQAFDEAAPDWAAGFFIAIVGLVTAALGAVFAFLGGGPASSAPRTRQANFG